MKISIFFLVILTITLKFTSAGTYKWQKSQLPNPFTQPTPFCNLNEKGIPFCDPDRQLEKNQVSYITTKQREIAQLGKCPCSEPCEDGKSGLVIGLVIVNEIDDSDKPKLETNEVNPKALQEFSEYVRQKWNLGSCDNSILITIATSPKQYGLSIGGKANKVLNETWFLNILEENFRDRANFNLYSKIKDILYMFKEAITEELKNNEVDSDGYASSLTDSNNNSTIYYVCMIVLVIVLILAFSLIAFVFLRHRKENDDMSLRFVWTKKFWLKAGNQYKEAKQSETSNEKDVEKNEDEEVKAKLASTEDLKAADDIESVDVKSQFPKLSKV